jgi:HEAT repeat protein
MSPAPDHRTLSPDDALPPVEPPSAGFILQLFVVPGVIVVIIVIVLLMFNWLAQKGNDPRAYIDQLQRNNAVRWQAAVNLANALREPHSSAGQELKGDRVTAQKLADILDTEIATGSMDEKLVTLRIFLCRTLGEFHVPEGLPVLMKAANEHKEKHPEVRGAALEAIALLAENIRKANPEHPLSNPNLEIALIEAADPQGLRTATATDSKPDRPEREEAARRSAAAFTLGVIGGEKCLAKLRSMLRDADTEVRYNAATGLARHGDISSEEVLVEMLDPTAAEGLKNEKETGSHEYKRAMILVNGLRAASRLAQQNTTDSLQDLSAAVDTLVEAEVPREIRVEAISLQAQLKNRSTK